MVSLKKYFAKSETGPHYVLNEDDVDIDLVNSVFQILDGLGGSNIGNKIVRNVKEHIKKVYTKTTDDPDATMPHFFSSQYLVETNGLINAFVSANAMVIKENMEKPISERGAASLIAATIVDNMFLSVSCGNCKGILVRSGHVYTFSNPENISLFSEDRANLRGKTLPINGIGLFENLQFNVCEQRLVEGDMIILMSDGVYAHVSDDEIRAIFEKREQIPAQIDKVFHLSNVRNNHDNQSMIVFSF